MERITLGQRVKIVIPDDCEYCNEAGRVWNGRIGTVTATQNDGLYGDKFHHFWVEFPTKHGSTESHFKRSELKPVAAS